MLILSLIAVGLWLIVALISVLVMMYHINPQPGSLMFSIVGILFQSFIVYSAYRNIQDLMECRNK